MEQGCGLEKVAGEGHAYIQVKKINCALLLHIGVSTPIGMQSAVMRTGSVSELSKA